MRGREGCGEGAKEGDGAGGEEKRRQEHLGGQTADFNGVVSSISQTLASRDTST